MTTIDGRETDELEFLPPGPGSWTVDLVHTPRPATCCALQLTPPAMAAGFAETFERYGLPVRSVTRAIVHGFSCSQQVLLKPSELEARGRQAEEMLATRRWRADLERWDREVKPQAILRHRALGAVEVDNLSVPELVDHLRECGEHWSAMVRQHHHFNGAAMFPLGDFLAFAQDVTGLPPAELVELFAGASPISRGDCPERREVVAAIEGDAAARDVLWADAPAMETLDRLRSDAVSRATASAMEGWLGLVGHRILDGFDVYQPCAIERPAILVSALRRAVEPAEAPDVSRRLDAVRAAVPASDREEFDVRYAEAAANYRLRDERGIYSDVTAIGLTRRAMLAAGRRLFASGSIDDPLLAVETTLDELVALLLGQAGPGAGELRRRRDFRASHTISEAPAHLGDPPPPPPPLELLPPAMARVTRAVMTVGGLMWQPTSPPSEPAMLTGIAANPGVYEGRARVVHDVDDLLAVEEGEVLVTITTGEAFNLAMSVASAVVTDQGGLMSHAAILAREFGIPAVVGTGWATPSIRTGTWLRVDGSKGEVTW